MDLVEIGIQVLDTTLNYATDVIAVFLVFYIFIYDSNRDKKNDRIEKVTLIQEMIPLYPKLLDMYDRAGETARRLKDDDLLSKLTDNKLPDIPDFMIDNKILEKTEKKEILEQMNGILQQIHGMQIMIMTSEKKASLK